MSKKHNRVFIALKIKKILGLDIGSKYIGVALGTESSGIAHAYDVLKWDGDEAVLLPFFRKLFEEESITKIVIGYVPGQENARVDAAREEIIRNLESISDVPVVLVDEHISTQEAENRLALFEEDPRMLRKIRKDAIAAQIILERYFADR